MPDHLPSERSCPPDIAIDLIEAELLRADLRVARCGTGGRLAAEVAMLVPVGAETNEVTVGLGMGDETAATLGACFEAYERYLLPTCVRLATRPVAAESVLGQAALQREWAGAFLAARAQAQAWFGCIAYRAADDDAVLHWPSALVWEDYPDDPLPGDAGDYSSLRRYASRGGTAIGMGFHEAAIHAASEAVERHALGCFLARHHFHGDPHALQAISRIGLRAEVLACWRDAEAVLGTEVELLDIGSGIGCPVMLARCPGRSAMGAHLLGTGCSMYPSLAARHALAELVQRYRCIESFAPVAAELRARRLRLIRFPRLLRCFEAIPSGMHVFRSRLPDDPPILSLVDQLHWLSATIARAGYALWLRELYRSPLGISLVSAVIPGAERFAVVLLGRVAVPRHPQRGTDAPAAA